MARKPPPHARLEAARAAHAAAEREIAQLEVKRNDALLADQDQEAAGLADQIEAQRRLLRGHQDKIALLGVEAEKAEGTRRAAQRLELIQRIEKKFAAREVAGAELTAAITAADAAFRKLLALGNEISYAWPWRVNDEDVASYLVPYRVVEITKHELFRLGSKPFLGGVAGAYVQPSFPGGLAPSMMLQGQPEKITSLVDVLKEATAYASHRMRSGRALVEAAPVAAQPAAPPPVTPPPAPNGTGAKPVPTTAADELIGPLPPPLVASIEPGSQLSVLLRQQAELAMKFDPASEAEYKRVTAEIATLQ